MQERSEISDLILCLKELKKKKKEETKSRVSRIKEIIKIRAEINEIENIIIEKINQTKHWFFEKMNKINKHLD